MERIENPKDSKNNNKDSLELLGGNDPEKKLKELKSDPNYIVYKLHELSGDLSSVKRSGGDYAIFLVKDGVFIPQEYKFSIEEIKENILENVTYCNDDIKKNYNLFQESGFEALDVLHKSIHNQQQYLDELIDTMNTIETVNNNFKKNSLFVIDDNNGGLNFGYKYLTRMYEIACHLNLIPGGQEVSVSKLITLLSEFYKTNYSNKINDEKLQDIQNKGSKIGDQILLLEEELNKRSK